MLGSPFYKRILLVALGCLAILVLLYNFKIGYEQRYESYGDAREYIAVGTAIAKTGSYGVLDVSNAQLIEDFKTGEVRNRAYTFKKHSTWRPPVWPYIIASVFTIFGYHLAGVLILKLVLILLGAYFFYLLLRTLDLSEGLVIAGIGLYVLHPAGQLYSRFFLSEPFTLFLMTCFLYATVQMVYREKSIWLVGILGGLLILCHPYFIFLPFALYFFLWMYKKVVLKKMLLCGILSATVVSVWVIRNTVVLETDKLVLTTSSGAALAKGWNSKITAEHSNTKGDLADETLVLDEYEHDRSIHRNEIEQSNLYTQAVLHFIKSNPDQMLPIVLTKLKSAFNPFAETPKPGVLEKGRVLFHILSLIALLYALFMAKEKVIKVFAWGLLIATIGITIVTYSGFRFRMPQIAIELLLISFMVEEVVVPRLKRSHKTFL